MAENKILKRNVITKKAKDALRGAMVDCRKINDPAFDLFKGCGRIAVLNPYNNEVVLVISKDSEYKPKLKSGIFYNSEIETYDWQYSEGSYHGGRRGYFQVDCTTNYMSKCPPITSRDGNECY